MELTSTVFTNGSSIPHRYGRDFDNINPPLSITNVPENAVSLVLIMDDPDVPEAAGVPVWDHWVVFNISAEITTIPEDWKVDGVRGVGTRNELDYGGPRPPDREHRYFFKLYALDKMLDLPEGSTKREVENAMESSIIESAELIGTFAPSV